MISKPPKYNGDTVLLFGKILKEIAENKDFGIFLREIEKKYYHWDKFRRIKIPNNFSHIELWEYIRYFREIHQQRIVFADTVFSFNFHNELLKNIHFVDLHFGGTLSGGIISEKQKEKFLQSSLIEESIASSQIEGASTTRKIAKEMIKNKSTPRTDDERMIVNNYNAMQYILAHKNEDLSEEKILELHTILMNGVMEKSIDIGRYRQGDDIAVMDALTGEIIHTPILYDRLETVMREFINFFNNFSLDSDFIHPVIKGIIVHFLIGWIHPFVDGNGRTARALFYWFLIKNDYWLSEYVSISRIIKGSKVQYKNAYLYTETDNNNLTYFIDYNLHCLIEGLSDFREYIQKKEKENKEALYKFGSNITQRQREMLIYMEKQGVSVLVTEVANIFNISKNMARLDLDSLVEKNFLKKFAINAKTFGYEII